MQISKLFSDLNRTLSHSGKSQPHRINIPGFNKEDNGIGDVIKNVTKSVGFSPCDGCQRRAENLNRWLVFSPQNRK